MPTVGKKRREVQFLVEVRKTLTQRVGLHRKFRVGQLWLNTPVTHNLFTETDFLLNSRLSNHLTGQNGIPLLDLPSICFFQLLFI